MCLTVVGKLKVATKPITVYKIISRRNRSFVRSFKYEPNTTYRLRKKLKVERNLYELYKIVNEGFHAFRSLSYTLDRSYRSYYENSKIVEFTIPRGAKYYIGNDDDIVATSIRSGSLIAMKKRDIQKMLNP